MLNVVAAVIVRGGKFFICKRPAGKHLGGYWEFPGGKAEAGETEEQALVRECGEELGVTVRPAGLLGRYVYAYPEKEISLALYFAEIVCGEIAPKEHSAGLFVTAAESEKYAFCPADGAALEKLRELL